MSATRATTTSPGSQSKEGGLEFVYFVALILTNDTQYVSCKQVYFKRSDKQCSQSCNSQKISEAVAHQEEWH